MHPVGSYCTDISLSTVNKTLNLQKKAGSILCVLKFAKKSGFYIMCP